MLPSCPNYNYNTRSIQTLNKTCRIWRVFLKTTIVKLKWTVYQKWLDLFVSGRQSCFSNRELLVDCGQLLIGMENPVSLDRQRLSCQRRRRGRRSETTSPTLEKGSRKLATLHNFGQIYGNVVNRRGAIQRWYRRCNAVHQELGCTDTPRTQFGAQFLV